MRKSEEIAKDIWRQYNSVDSGLSFEDVLEAVARITRQETIEEIARYVDLFNDKNQEESVTGELIMNLFSGEQHGKI